jgi:hypothetical protein
MKTTDEEDDDKENDDEKMADYTEHLSNFDGSVSKDEDHNPPFP